MKKHPIVFCICAALVAFTGCTQSPGKAGATASPQTTAYTSSEDAMETYVDTGAMDLTITDRDKDASYDAEGACLITFTDSTVQITGEGASAEGTVVTVSQEGTYILSGMCSDGRVAVNAGDADKVQLVMSGLDLTSADGCPFLVLAADKVFLTLDEGTENRLADTETYTLTVEDTTVDAAVYSQSDLTINGEGSLTVEGSYKHGIVSKDDLIMTGGTVDVNAVKDGLEGKDCVKLFGGALSIVSGSDGIRSDYTEDASRGFVVIDGADVAITSGTDGIQAETLVSIASGTVDITSGGGSANASQKTSSGMAWGNWGGEALSSEDTSGAKGIQCTLDVVISGGTVTVDSSDDALHAHDSMEIRGGTLRVSSGDDGIHADLALTIQGGNLSIDQSYEGLEAGQIAVSGGVIYVESQDDGLNAAGGNDQSSMNGRMGQNSFAVDSSKSVTISGGYLVVNASGDGLDSNGSLTVTGGVTLVSGPTNSGNGALDSATQAVITGGIVLAAGSAGMAETFSEMSSQGSIQWSISLQSAETTIALCDSDGNILVSFTPMKDFENVVVSVPGISEGETYTLVTGSVADADAYGYVSGGSLTDADELASVDMTALHYSSGGSSFGGMTGGPGGMGGVPQRP